MNSREHTLSQAKEFAFDFFEEALDCYGASTWFQFKSAVKEIDKRYVKCVNYTCKV